MDADTSKAVGARLRRIAGQVQAVERTGGRRLWKRERAVDRDFGSLRFGAVRVEARADRLAFAVEVFAGALDPAAISDVGQLDAFRTDGPYERPLGQQFTRAFRRFTFAESNPYPRMLEPGTELILASPNGVSA
jgi:hypothetical protein